MKRKELTEILRRMDLVPIDGAVIDRASGSFARLVAARDVLVAVPAAVDCADGSGFIQSPQCCSTPYPRVPRADMRTDSEASPARPTATPMSAGTTELRVSATAAPTEGQRAA